MVNPPPRIKKVQKCQCLSNNISLKTLYLAATTLSLPNALQSLGCPHPPLPGSAFCQHHKDTCSYGSPLSGYEPRYDPKLWNNKKELRETHNCFAYAMNIIDPKQIMNCLSSEDCGFHQPGAASGREGFSSSMPKTCPDMLTRILGDNPSIKRTTFLEKCPARTSKIALVVDEDEDYHFLRQDADGWWSQKGGAKPVVKVDASNRPIWNPELADHNWTNASGKLDYDRFCGYMCIPRKIKNVDLRLKISTGGRRTKKNVASRAPRSKKYRVRQTRRYQGRKV